MGQDENSEKKYLLSRLEELLRLEKQQVNADLKARRKQLGETRVGQKDEYDGLKRKHEEEIALMRLRQQEERRRVEAHFPDIMYTMYTCSQQWEFKHSWIFAYAFGYFAYA